MKKQTHSVLRRVLAAMLTENCGRALCDSGGAYGRNWERNQAKTVADFAAAPEVTLEAEAPRAWKTEARDGQPARSGIHPGYFNATISVFHFLDKCLDRYESTLTRKLWRWGARKENEREGWMGCVDSWLESIGAEDGPDSTGSGWVNTYNGGDSCLSQVIQYRGFSLDGCDYVALQIHGGCDVRGGYTRPRVFALPRYADVSLYDDARFVIGDSRDSWYHMGPGNGWEPSDHNEGEYDMGAAEFSADPADRGRGKIYVDENEVPHSPLTGEPLKGWIL